LYSATVASLAMLATLPSRTRMPPNKRLKLTGPALKGTVHLCADALTVHREDPCARRRSPRSLSAIR